MQDNKVLNLYPIDYPFETLVDRVKKGKLNLNPEFQRKYKWDKDGNERASKFIESCLMRIPLPACYLAENEDNSQDVIDGVQRITTICNFFNDTFALEGLTIFKELEGKKFSQLENYKSDLETTTIRCIILRKDNKKELIQEIFARLNQGAVQLTSQEIRHAIFPGSFDNLLQKLAILDQIQNFGVGERGTSTKDGREADEIVLRFFAMNGDLSDYDSNLTKYLDKFVENNQVLSIEKINEFEDLFKTTLKKCIDVFENKVFIDTNKEKPKQSLIFYDLLMWSFSKETEEFLLNKKEELKQSFSEMCLSEEFKRTISGGTQMKTSILNRRRLWINKLNQIKQISNE
jgi:hypothetical protein